MYIISDCEFVFLSVLSPFFLTTQRNQKNRPRERKKNRKHKSSVLGKKTNKQKRRETKKKLTDTYKKTDDMREAHVFVERSQRPRRNRLCLYLNLLCFCGIHNELVNKELEIISRSIFGLFVFLTLDSKKKKHSPLQKKKRVKAQRERAGEKKI